MSSLLAPSFRVLGELELRRGEARLELPPSKKTRALLAYLVLTARSHRREHLCGLLWDVADDPRGALRWSLSKLRSLVDDEGTARIVADRDHVRFEAHGARVDALELRRALGGRGLSSLDTQRLEELSSWYRGELLEGLDLPDFDDYQAWCVGEREQARSLRASVLAELVTRHRDAPEDALRAARAWTQVDPMNESARAALVRLLGSLGRRDEARQCFESGRRLEQELGRKGRGELLEAWRGIESRAASPAVSAAPKAGESTLPGSVHGVVARADADVPRLVGRARELAMLESAYELVRTRKTVRTWVLSGEPGVGKTHLVKAFERALRARGAVTLHAASFEAESGHPYGPFLDALRRHAAARSIESTLFEPTDGYTRDPLGRERIFAAVNRWLSELSRGTEQPLVIVLDDVQWLDEGSAELLHYIARTRREEPLLLLLVSRAGELSDNPWLVRVLRGLKRESLVEEHVLGPLDEAETLALVRPIRSDVDAARLFALSAGNPLFALELAHADLTDEERVPSGLGELVRDRLHQLPAEAADVLRWAAVLGRSFRVEELDSLTTIGADHVVRAVELLQRRGLLTEEQGRADGARHCFVHEVMRRAVYSDLSEPRRRLMHLRVAELLAKRAEQGQAEAADVAHHAALAHDAALAADACLRAARRSLRMFANADAHALARRGMRHAEQLQDPERTRKLLELFEVSLSARRPEEATNVAAQIEQLAEHALDLGSLEHARIGFHTLGYLRFAHGEWRDAGRHLLQAELVSRGGDERARVLGMAEAARCLVILERDLGHAQALALEAAARARPLGIEPPAVLDALGMLELHRGRLDEASRELERARALASTSRERHDEFQALEHLVMLELERSDYRAALRKARELELLGEKLREGSEAPFARALSALCGSALGDEGAEARLERELHALTLLDAKHRLGYVLTRSSLVDLSRGEPVRAEAKAQRALEIAALLERPTELALALVVLARAAAARGDHTLANEHLRALSAQPLGWVSTHVRKLAEEELRAIPGAQGKQDEGET